MIVNRILGNGIRQQEIEEVAVGDAGQQPQQVVLGQAGKAAGLQSSLSWR